VADIAFAQKVVWTPSGGAGSITTSVSSWLVIFLTTDAGASSVAFSSSVSGAFGAAKDTENDAGDFQDCYAFAKYCGAGTHSITSSGSGISFDTACVVEVANGDSAGYDQAPGQVQTSTTAPSSGNTGTLAAAPALGVAVSFCTSFGGVTPVNGSGFADNGTISNAGMTGRVESKRVTATTAFAGDFTSTSGTFTTIMVVIKEAGGGAATTDTGGGPTRDLLTGRLPHLRMAPKGFARRDRIYVPARLAV